MIDRCLFASVLDALADVPAVALLGPRQAGKTTLALRVAEHVAKSGLSGRQSGSLYLDLESPSDRQKLTDPEAYLSHHADKLVILDEVQQMPALFQVLRGLIDQGRRQGQGTARFLLLGSATGELLRQSSESLAGRVVYLELPPLQLLEGGLAQQDVLWLRGGFPNSFLAKSLPKSMAWRQNLIKTYLERDIPSFGARVPAETLRRLWVMLAHQQGGLLDVSQLGKSLMLDAKTVHRYLDMLVDLMLVRRVQAWYSNAGKRLVKSPKLYVRDSGLVHALLGIGTQDALLSHPVVGNSWEGFALETLLNAAPLNTSSGFYRTSNGAEVDLLLDIPGHGVWAIEVKRGVASKPRKGFYSACEDLKPAKRWLVYPGTDAYPVGDGVQVIGLHNLAETIWKIHRDRMVTLTSHA
ncbi:ATP-binding protein [Limnohabitans sp.]|jgi:predicted AAA+ superfamily ATPase|uniref:ATP-binding protein n=1 Tax=Limnohabitans sp. TaxID=1907725 RepID=UPI0037BFBEC3